MYKINSSFENGAVAVPTDLIDKYLKLAPAASFKVLLFILRNPNSAIDEKQIAFCTGLTEEEAEACVEYWMDCGVVFDDGKKDEEKINTAKGNLKKIDIAIGGESADLSRVTNVRSLPVKKPTQREIAERINESEELTVLYREAQKIVGTFGYDTQSLLLMIYDYFGFSVDLIITLLSYQRAEGNLSSMAIKKRAEDWTKRGIDSIEAAISEIAALEKIQKTYIEIKAVIKYENEKPTPKMAKYLRDWAVSWSFSDEMIFYALKESGNSFPEANKLLKKWNSMNITDVAQAEAKKRKFAPQEIKKSYDENNIGRSSVLERMKSKNAEKEGVKV